MTVGYIYIGRVSCFGQWVKTKQQDQKPKSHSLKGGVCMVVWCEADRPVRAACQVVNMMVGERLLIQSFNPFIEQILSARSSLGSIRLRRQAICPWEGHIFYRARLIFSALNK